jgi:hypothetical protein
MLRTTLLGAEGDGQFFPHDDSQYQDILLFQGYPNFTMGTLLGEPSGVCRSE